jgi:hypothetical protein
MMAVMIMVERYGPRPLVSRESLSYHAMASHDRKV